MTEMVKMPDGSMIELPEDYVGDRVADKQLVHTQMLHSAGALKWPEPSRILTWCRACHQPARFGCSMASPAHQMTVAPAFDPETTWPEPLSDGEGFVAPRDPVVDKVPPAPVPQSALPWVGPEPSPVLLSPHQRVLGEIAAERKRHVEVHGWHQRHDDRLRDDEWVWLLAQRTTTLLAPTLSAKERRRALIELCAIAEAAVEAHDRSVDG